MVLATICTGKGMPRQGFTLGHGLKAASRTKIWNTSAKKSKEKGCLPAPTHV